MSAQPLDSRMARIEGSFEQIDKRLTSLEQRVDRGFDQMHERFGRLEQRMDRQFFWLLGVFIASVLLPIASRAIQH